MPALIHSVLLRVPQRAHIPPGEIRRTPAHPQPDAAALCTTLEAAWLDFGMNKREIRVIILLIVISLIAISFPVFFPRPELWTLVVSGIGLLATVIMLVVLWKAVLRQRADYWRRHQSRRGGKTQS